MKSKKEILKEKLPTPLWNILRTLNCLRYNLRKSLFEFFAPTSVFLKKKFKKELGYELNLKNPKTFAEKLQWLKIHDHKKIYRTMVDKADSKTYIKNILGEDVCVPTLAIYDSFDKIDWDYLPKSFILKATHDSGSYYIVNDKSNFDKDDCKKHLYCHWKSSYYKMHREWQYKGLKRRIIAEPLIGTPKELKEYKFFCFNGEPKIYQTCYDRDNSRGGAILNFYDLEGKLLDIHDKKHTRDSDIKISLSKNMDRMIEISKILSKNTFFLRVDFFEVEDKFYLGELTLHENAGFVDFSPDEWNTILGNWIKIDKGSLL